MKFLSVFERSRRTRSRMISTFQICPIIGLYGFECAEHMIHVPKLSTVSTFESALDLHRNPFQPEKNSITFPISYICVNGRTILWQIWLIYFIDKHLTKLYKKATSAVWKLDKFGYIKKKKTSTLEYFKLRKRKKMAKAFIFAICVALFWSTGKYFLFF